MLRPVYVLRVCGHQVRGVANNALNSYSVLEPCNPKLVFSPVGMTSSYLNFADAA